MALHRIAPTNGEIKQEGATITAKIARKAKRNVMIYELDYALIDCPSLGCTVTNLLCMKYASVVYFGEN